MFEICELTYTWASVDVKSELAVQVGRDSRQTVGISLHPIATSLAAVAARDGPVRRNFLDQRVSKEGCVANSWHDCTRYEGRRIEGDRGWKRTFQILLKAPKTHHYMPFRSVSPFV